MLDEMTPEEFAGWEAFASLRPFGVLKEAERFAALVVTQCVDVDPDDVLRAWGFDIPLVKAEDVLDEDATFAAVCAAFGVS